MGSYPPAPPPPQQNQTQLGAAAAMQYSPYVTHTHTHAIIFGAFAVLLVWCQTVSHHIFVSTA